MTLFRIFSTRLITTKTGLIRNIAIIAHVDHGKTTLVDSLLKSTGILKSNTAERVLDFNVLEKERGITISAKSTSLRYRKHTINIMDTPGHADFGGEVERALALVDGVILLVDSTEGPMAQTRYVLSKALSKNMKPLVILNKADRSTSRCDEVDSDLFEIFSNLGASEDQLNYRLIYASAKEGWASECKPTSESFNLSENPITLILDHIIKSVPPPCIRPEPSFTFLVNSIQQNQFFGRCYLGKVESGELTVGDKIKSLSPDGKDMAYGKISKIYKHIGMEQVCKLHIKSMNNILYVDLDIYGCCMCW